MVPIPKATAFTHVFKAYLSSDHVSEATGKTIAITISKNGGAFGNPNAGATNATEIANGWYKVTLDTTDTGTEGVLAIRGTAATIDDVGDRLLVVKATNGGWTALPDTAVSANASLLTSGTGTAQLSVSSGQVILQSGTGTGQLSFASGILKVDVDTIKTNPVVNGGTITFPTGATLASTSNITGGTITTVTNLTNAPTSGDFTSTMKTSLNAATPSVTVSDKTGFSLAQSFPSNFASLAITAAGKVTVGTNDDKSGYTVSTVSDKTGYALTSAYDPAKTAAQAGDAMTLTSGERTAIANEVEAQIIDETDSEKVLTAITDKIAAVNPDLSGLTLSAIASSVWSNGTRILTAGTNIVLAKGTGVTGLNDLSAAGVRSAVGLASANLDTQLDALPTNAELATALGTADDATLAAIGDLPSASDVADEVESRTLLADVRKVNNVTVNGTGTTLDPWGP